MERADFSKPLEAEPAPQSAVQPGVPRGFEKWTSQIEICQEVVWSRLIGALAEEVKARQMHPAFLQLSDTHSDWRLTTQMVDDDIYYIYCILLVATEDHMLMETSVY